MREVQYELRKYRSGNSSKGRCPSCGANKSFRFFVYAGTDTIVNPLCGYCDHITNCGYRKTPWELTDDERKANNAEPYKSSNLTYQKEQTVAPIVPIPRDFLTKSLIVRDGEIIETPLTDYLLSLGFNRDAVIKSLLEYNIGYTKNKGIIYWQVDEYGRVRAGKIMQYLPNGHRDKIHFGNWIHSVMGKRGILPKGYWLSQCLFGEHLLEKYPNKDVAIVESEKSALICSMFSTDYIWMACGGITNLSRERCLSIIKQRRTIHLFPDHDGVSDWWSRLTLLKYTKVIVETFVEDKWKEEDGETADIADILIRLWREHQAQGKVEEPSIKEQVENALHLEEPNAALRLLIDKFEIKDYKVLDNG